MQQLHGSDNEFFPFVIALNQTQTQIFILNTKSKKRVPLVNLIQLHEDDKIYSVQQTSKYIEQNQSTIKNLYDLEEIMIHFKLKLNRLQIKDGKETTLSSCEYC